MSEYNLETKIIAKIAEKELESFLKTTLKDSVKMILKTPDLYTLQNEEEIENRIEKKRIQKLNEQTLKNIFEVCDTILTNIESNFSHLPK